MSILVSSRTALCRFLGMAFWISSLYRLRMVNEMHENGLEIRRCASNCIQLHGPLPNAATAHR
jgi:hypothetical protein